MSAQRYVLTSQDTIQFTPKKLSFVESYLSVWILLAMVLGAVFGIFVPGIQTALNGTKIDNVSLPVFIGLLLMLYPVFCKVEYEKVQAIAKTPAYLKYLLISMALNWIICPLFMLGLAWLTLFDLTEYRVGVVLIGAARCIAMVLIWNDLANGNHEWCVVLVVVNSLLQMILFAPLSYLLTVILAGSTKTELLGIWLVSKNVLMYLGIPFFSGIITKVALEKLTSKEWYKNKFLPIIGPLALIGLLYTIFIMFALQGKQIVEQVVPVIRVTVPLFLYFVVVWFSTMAICYYLNVPFDIAIAQSFTAGSNNFELAMAVAVSTFGIDSKEALATTVGPLVEVPVLLGLVSVVPRVSHWYNAYNSRVRK